MKKESVTVVVPGLARVEVPVAFIAARMEWLAANFAPEPRRMFGLLLSAR
jgi:hypothetical protein